MLAKKTENQKILAQAGNGYMSFAQQPTLWRTTTLSLYIIHEVVSAVSYNFLVNGRHADIFGESLMMFAMSLKCLNMRRTYTWIEIWMDG